MSLLKKSCFCVVFLVAHMSLPAPSAGSDWDVSAYKNWVVSSVTIEGLDKETASALKSGLELARPGGLLGAKLPIFFPQKLDDDIRRSILFLARRGYPYAKITPRFDPHPKRKRIGIILHVERGPAVRVVTRILAGIPLDLEEDARQLVNFNADSVVVDAEIEKAKTDLITFLNNKGYARAAVESGLEWMDSTHVVLRFRAQTGEMYYFGNTIVTGASEDVIPLIKKVSSIQRGARYEPKTLDEAQNKLRILDLFRRIRIDVKVAAPDTLDCVVNIEMKKPRRWEVAVRYWSDEKLDGSVSWKHRNLFKRGRGGTAFASASFIRRKLEFSAWWPALLMAPSRATATVGIEKEIEESYDLTSYGGSIGLNYDFSLKSRMRVALVFSNIDITAKTTDVDALETQDGTLNSLQFRWERNASNHPIVPTQGTYVFVDVEWAPDSPLNDYRFVSISPTGIIYQPLAESHEWVLASRVTAGFARPLGKMIDLLPNKRFYSGGATSMRGFQRRKLGPLDSNDAPLGGEAKLEGSAELRFPFFWKFRGTWFVDAGQVWPTIDRIIFDNFEVATGPGLWLETPIGPLRFDLAYRLTDFEKSQPRTVFHFSIGPAF